MNFKHVLTYYIAVDKEQIWIGYFNEFSWNTVSMKGLVIPWVIVLLGFVLS